MEKNLLIPATDIMERENEYLLFAEMPGVSKNTLEIEVEKNNLKIKGTPDWNKDNQWESLYKEFTDHYEFERNFAIGDDIDREKIKAKIENGILAVVLPKSEKAKPKKIEIK